MNITLWARTVITTLFERTHHESNKQNDFKQPLVIYDFISVTPVNQIKNSIFQFFYQGRQQPNKNNFRKPNKFSPIGETGLNEAEAMNVS